MSNGLEILNAYSVGDQVDTAEGATVMKRGCLKPGDSLFFSSVKFD